MSLQVLAVMEVYFGERFQTLVIAPLATKFGVAQARQSVLCIIPIGEVESTVWYGPERLIESGDWFFGDTQPITWYA